MRSLLVEPDFDDNGAIRVSLDRASRWSKMGAEVSTLFVSGQASGTRAVVPNGLRTIIANRGLRSARWMLPNAIARGLRPARKADVIVAGREIASGLLIGSLLAKLARRPLAVTIHSNVDAALAHHGTPRHRRNVLASLRGANLLTPVSRGLIPGLLELGMGKDRVQAVENGMDRERLSRLAKEQPDIDPPRGPFVMAIGRLIHQKGFDTLIRAHALALQQGAPRHSVLIAGEGPDQQALVDLATDLGVATSVRFSGFLTNPYSVLARADLFVLSSRWEGFPLALAETAVLGIPAVACDCVAGPSEISDGGRYCDLIPIEDEQALADAITHHFKNPERLKSMAIEGSAFVERRYSADRAARDHLEALRLIAFEKA